MLRRMALWSTVGAVMLITTVAIGQPRDASITTTGVASPGDAGAAKTSAVFGVTRPGDAGVSPTATGAPGSYPPATAAPTVAEGRTANTAEKAEVDAATYAVRLRDLEQRINELKEQIFRSKARLSLLAETVLQGVVAGSQTVVVHENKMSGSYKLVKAVYALDGAPIFNRADEEGGLSEKTEFDVYNGSIVPGEHTLTVNLEYRGHGYGIFSYLKVSAYHEALRMPLEERPAIRYQERVTETGAPQQVAEAQGGK